MWSLLLSLSLLALSPTPTLWQFDGQLASQAQQWIQRQYGGTLTDHLLDEASLKAHLESISPATLKNGDPLLQGCLRAVISSEQAGCQLDELLLREAQLAGKVYLNASVKGAEFQMTLVIDRPGEEPQVFQSTGSALKTAGRGVIERAFGMGTLTLSGIPEEAKVLVDGVEIGRGPGSYVVTAERHQLKVTATDYQEYIMAFDLKAGQLMSQELTLLSSLATLDVKVLHKEDLEGLTILIDDKELTSDERNALYELPPGKHRYRISAVDRQSVERDFELKPGEAGKLVVNLQYDRAPWKIALKRPHPDTEYGRQQIALRLQSQTLRSGAWEADVSDYSGNPAPSSLQSQTQSMNGFGFDLSFDWLISPEMGVGPMRLNPIGYGFEYFGESEAGEERSLDNRSVTSVGKRYTLKSLARHKTRLLWVGYQLPMWRVVPYAQAGLLWVYERGEIERSTSVDSGIVSAHSLRLGWELGVDVRLSPEWVIKASMMSDVWPGERSAIQTLIGGAYAFDALHSPLL